MRSKGVAKIDSTGHVISRYKSVRSAALYNFMSRQTVSDYCNHKQKRQQAPDGFYYVWSSEIEVTSEQHLLRWNRSKHENRNSSIG